MSPVRAIRLILALVTLVASEACGPAGTAQVPIQEKPLDFIDGRSGRTVERVLLIPKYGAATGVSTGAGHGPGAMIDSSFLASPVVYDSGSPLRLAQPDSKGVLAGPLFFVGRGVTIDGVLVVAPGYRATWFAELWNRPSAFTFALPPLDDQSEASRLRLVTLLEKSKIRGRELTDEERRAFNTIPDFDIDVKFTPDERKRIREFLSGPARR